MAKKKKTEILPAPEEKAPGPPGQRARTYGIIGIVCAGLGFLAVGGLLGFILGPAAIVLGFLARKGGEQKMGLVSIWLGVAVIVLSGVMLVIFLTTGWTPLPAPPPKNTETQSAAIAALLA